ncbi:DinB family protein [Rubrivirga sp.]|uniref:DinB family protein n=1 Tax=Rubrivirga sp. TaxID=1885344 RepID=UPI003C751150
MTDQLAQIAETYRDAQRRLHALDARIDDETFNAKPSEKSWSVGECIVHLNTMAKGYLPVFDAALEDVDAPKADGPFRWGWFSRKFIDMIRPGTRPIPTAGAMKPPSTTGLRSEIDRERAVSRFDSDIARYLEIIETSDGLDLAAIRVASPFLKLMRLPLGAFLEAMGVHAQRHIAQAERAADAAAG